MNDFGYLKVYIRNYIWETCEKQYPKNQKPLRNIQKPTKIFRINVPQKSASSHILTQFPKVVRMWISKKI